MTNLDSIVKSRDITLSTRVPLVKALVFPVLMSVWESWTLKKAERRRTDAFELWYWRRLLKVPWTARSSNQSILKQISAGCSFEGLMLKLKLQYFGHLMRRVDSFEKTLRLGKIEGWRRRRRQDEMVGWHHQLDGHGFGWTLGVGNGQRGLACCGSWSREESDTTERLSWTGIPSLPLALFVVMLPKAYLTSHSRTSDSRWVITPLWLTGSWRSFLYSSSH